MRRHGNSANYTVSARVVDEDRVARVEFWLNGALVSMLTQPTAGQTYSVTMQIRASGAHAIQILASDAAENITEARTTITR